MFPAGYFPGLESTSMRHKLEKVLSPGQKNEFP
jgi:hypothetical protein